MRRKETLLEHKEVVITGKQRAERLFLSALFLYDLLDIV